MERDHRSQSNHIDRSLRASTVGDRRDSSRRVLRFVALFAGSWLLAQALLAVFPEIERWVLSATVSSLVIVGGWMPGGAAAVGTSVRILGANLQIVPDCTPLMPTILLWSGIVAFPSTFSWTLAGLVVGAALLWVYNILRVLTLAFVLANRPSLFEFVHVYLWLTTTAVLVFGLFALWLRLPKPRTVP